MSKGPARIEGLQKLLEQNHLDCAMIGPTTNMVYLLGNSPHPDERLCLLLISDDKVQIIAPKLNADTISSFTDVEMLTWADAEGPGSALSSSFLKTLSPGTVAVDGSMRADFLLPVMEAFKPERVVSVDPVIATMRIQKSPEEIELLAEAAVQADRAMEAAVEACRPGVTEQEVAWAAEEAFRKDGAEHVEFTLVATGGNAAFPHHHSGEKVLRKGEGIIIDIGASLKRYKSDITRVVFLGEPDKQFLKTYEVVRLANKKGRQAVKPGVSAEAVDSATRSVIEEAGFAEYFIHRTGHGLGLDIHELPWIQQGNELLLDTGMVFSVEPGFYLPGKLGIRVEDIVAVTSDGVRTLTGYSHSLVIK